MDILVGLAKGFINLFQTGGKTFMGWMTTIVPLVLMLLVAMNALISLIGEEKINKLASKSSGNPLLRYMVLPFLGAFMLANPMVHSLGRFMPEYYKPSYFASAAYFCHTSNGIFPHINAAELFIWLGIAQGVQTLGLDPTPLAIRYLLVGLVANFFCGWVTDFLTGWVSKQQNVTLSKQLKVIREGE
ncbi:PTS glucitol/sorbitol transporter subunit IIC [Sporolactobacillus sp. THM7-4]|nr:PTS glucitol/sorbitol transporter subunit IIC [Sporolactobacillus sp. THM7-4]